MVFAECLLLRTAVGLQPLQQGLSARTLVYPDSFQTTSLQRSNCILSPPLVRKLSRASKMDTGSNLQKGVQHLQAPAMRPCPRRPRIVWKIY